MKKISIWRSTVVQALTVCPYCMNEVQTDPHHGCCGEVHAETAYVTADGETLLSSEVILVDDDDHDPTPWCAQCGAKAYDECHCGPIADNN